MEDWVDLLARIIGIFIIIGIPTIIIIKIKNYIEDIIIRKRLRKQWSDKINNTEPLIYEETKTVTTEQSNKYQKKLLLTKNEWFEWKKLKQYCDEKGYLICPKVRLLDLVAPKAGAGYMTRFHKVQAKHVDFVICNSQMYVLGVVELDDNSHNREDRIERDAFVDDVLRGVGYKVHRTWSITENTLNFITDCKE